MSRQWVRRTHALQTAAGEPVWEKEDRCRHDERLVAPACWALFYYSKILCCAIRPVAAVCIKTALLMEVGEGRGGEDRKDGRMGAHKATLITI